MVSSLGRYRSLQPCSTLYGDAWGFSAARAAARPRCVSGARQVVVWSRATGPLAPGHAVRARGARGALASSRSRRGCARHHRRRTLAAPSGTAVREHSLVEDALLDRVFDDPCGVLGFPDQHWHDFAARARDLAALAASSSLTPRLCPFSSRPARLGSASPRAPSPPPRPSRGRGRCQVRALLTRYLSVSGRSTRSRRTSLAPAERAGDDVDRLRARRQRPPAAARPERARPCAARPAASRNWCARPRSPPAGRRRRRGPHTRRGDRAAAAAACASPRQVLGGGVAVG